MKQVNPKDYLKYLSPAEQISCGTIYSLLIATGIQQGEIFENSNCVLYWHCCGFAFLSGSQDERSLEAAYRLLFGQYADRRAVLFVTEQEDEQFFRKKGDVVLEKRYFFEYRGDCPKPVSDLPAGYRLQELDSRLLPRLTGRITPSFSWKNPDAFLEKGKGYCIMDADCAAAWAFTAAVSDDEIDIGVETNKDYQHRGLAYIVTNQMIQYCFHQRKKPVWACHSQNIASRKLAEKCGFVKTAECWTVKKANT